jgi:uncharacterized membrane protein YdbT with pleckstrin-like domain
VVKIKPSLIPFTWKGLVLLLLAAIVYALALTFQLQIPAIGSLATFVVLGLLGLGLLSILVSLARRNAFTYTLTDSDIVVEKKLFSRSVRRIPFSSISDIEVSQTFIGRLAGYGTIAPVTKSGYGLVRGMERDENIVAQMTNVPKPDKVAEMIMSRISVTPKLASN